MHSIVFLYEGALSHKISDFGLHLLQVALGYRIPVADLFVQPDWDSKRLDMMKGEEGLLSLIAVQAINSGG